MPIYTVEEIRDIHDRAYQKGKTEGYANGYADGRKDVKEKYGEGVNEGYARGREDGFWHDFPDIHFRMGPQDDTGESEGYDEGHDDGFNEGYIAGFDAGYEEGSVNACTLLVSIPSDKDPGHNDEYRINITTSA